MCAFQRVSEFTGTVREHFIEEVKSELNGEGGTELSRVRVRKNGYSLYSM